ncbi:acyltransferase family protein [Phocaeicola plebeius]|uniref:acyltransferase n=1 Tax=Phocaeicola plebeius TaxID=310297 RepID=UPI00195B11C3|nr:acyltransferase family protein [Phocaeicola plebeius]MBM6963897.1 acyltransferase family protein [Phocaeicola plebeius]
MQAMLKTRESNFELLRIFAMFCVIVHHSLFETNNIGYNDSYNIGNNGIIAVFFNSCAIIGVNLFILISGYFSCKTPIKNIGKLLIEIICITIVSYLIGGIINQKFELLDLIKLIKWEILHNWFIVSYIMLLFSLPLIEPALASSLTIHKEIKTNLFKYRLKLSYLDVVFICSSILTFFYGFILGILNTDGYNVLNFLYIYVCGRWIRKNINRFQNIKISNFILIYIIISVLLTIYYISIFNNSGTENDSFKTMRYFGYNNPLIIFSACTIFCFFSRLKLKSSLTNKMATAVFGVFIIQGIPSIAETWRFYARLIFENYSYIGLIFYDIILYLICLTMSYSIKKSLVLPIINKYINTINHVFKL